MKWLFIPALETWAAKCVVDAGTHPYGTGSNYLSLAPTYYHSFDNGSSPAGNLRHRFL